MTVLLFPETNNIIIVQPRRTVSSVVLFGASVYPANQRGIQGIQGEPGVQGEPGPQGIQGLDATVHSRRYEEAGSYIYCATAPTDSLETDPVWRITRITYSSGSLVATEVATNVTWSGRAGHIYI